MQHINVSMGVRVVQQVGLGYGLDATGFEAGRGMSAFPRNPDRFWGPSSLLLNGYRVYFREKSGWGLKLTSLSNAEVKKSGGVSLLPLYGLMV